MRGRRLGRGLAGLGAALVLGACGGAPLPAQPTPAHARTSTGPASRPARPLRWILAASALHALGGSTPLTRAWFDHPTTFLITRAGHGMPPGWTVTPIVSVRSLAALRAVLAPGHLPATVRGVGYDNEAWPFTPPSEQQNAAAAEATAARLVHASGRLYLQLGNLPSFGGSRYGGARVADVIDLQLQSAERDPSRYAARVRTAAATARRFHPGVIVIAGLSTNPPPGKPVTVSDLVQDVLATRAVVDGYWLNVPAPGAACPRCGPQDPQLALAFLRALERHGIPPG